MTEDQEALKLLARIADRLRQKSTIGYISKHHAAEVSIMRLTRSSSASRS